MHPPRSSTARLARLLLTILLTLTGLIGFSQVAHADILLVDRADDAAGLPCTGAANDCSLRSAIEIANANGATADQIGFAASYTINLAGTLDLSADNTTINGQLSQTIRINGAGIIPGLGIPGNVFRISGSGIKLQRLSIYGAPAGWSNIWITGSAQRVSIANNVIGDDNIDFAGCGQSPDSYGGIYIDSTGTVPVGSARAWIYGNAIECNEGTPGDALNPGDGITIVNSDQVVISANESGASTESERNFIESNGGNGVTIEGASANNRIMRAGIQYNGTNGIAINGATNNVIGGSGDQRNSIGGNGYSGVVLSGGAANNQIQGNYIGTTGLGTTANANGVRGTNSAQRSGVAIINSANNTIGGPTENSRNVISGNLGSGVYITGASASGNLVDGNTIGVSASGTALGNREAGIALVGAGANTLGHSNQANPQDIGGNGLEGIYIINTNGTQIYSSNFVGFTVFGRVPGNTREGILLNNASNTTITPYSVMGNGRAGIAIITSSSSNRIAFTENRGNGGLAIDLGNNGLTPNDAGDADSGPNGLLNYPLITSVSGTAISGTACPSCLVTVLRADGSVGAPFGGGGLLVGTVANAAGSWSATLPSGYTRLTVTAFATDSAGNTSEMTPRPQIYMPLSQK